MVTENPEPDPEITEQFNAASSVNSVSCSGSSVAQSVLRPLSSVLWIASLFAITGCATAPTEYHEPAALGPAERTAHNLTVFDRVWTLVNEKYFDPKFRGVDWEAQRVRYRPEAAAAPDEDALYRVLNRMNEELKESHLGAFAPRRAHELGTEHRAAVGLRWLNVEGKRVVVEIVPGSPAAAAGVELGWFVVSRNGQPIKDGDTYIPLLGRPVTYGFLDEQNHPRSLVFEPRLISFVRREAHVLPGGFLHLRFDEFDREFLSWLSEQLKTKPTPPGVIVDLRANPGGHALALSVAVAEFFPQRVAEGRLIKRSGAEREEHSFSWLSAHYSGRVVVLTSILTGSAAEIFTHVLQYHHRAQVVGQRTAGAVIYSRHWSLPGGGSLQVPFMDYVGLDGQRLEGRGVMPDVQTPRPTLADLRAGTDPALVVALDLLHQPGTTPTQ